MAQRRMLSRRIAQSKKVNRLPLKAQIIYTWTIPWLDDYGCYNGDPEDIKTEVLPKNKRISVKDVETALRIMAESGLIIWYTDGNGKLVQQYPNFNDFQTLKTDRARVSEYPQYEPENEGMVPVGNQRIPEGSLSKVKLREVKLSKVNKYTDDFESFWKKWPGRWSVDKGKYIKVGKYDASVEWQALSLSDQRKAWCAADKVSGKYVPDACRWLKGRRFDDYEVPSELLEGVRKELKDG